jgi:hypothetical protein
MGAKVARKETKEIHKGKKEKEKKEKWKAEDVGCCVAV